MARQKGSKASCLDGRLAYGRVAMGAGNASGTSDSVVSCHCGVRGGAVIDHAVIRTVVVSSSTSQTVLFIAVDFVIVVAGVDTKSRWVNVAVTEEEHSTEDWLGKDVQNTVEDSFRVW